nr:CCR4-NOT transcription complex subunit 3 [Kwoniella mangroviensis CBS 8507]OCF69331.1 CCR4-NOT transcription complex subunit 3 [Kwoniella mangroviensis CBS 8507]
MSMRKLAAEIDKTLKQVAVGVETFELTFDKLGHATNSTQKEKTENDLKAQIKKLQKMRDQIKAWIGNNDIKDKNALLDNRKLIEVQMERFKALEKEMKMKAFSKEGLIAKSKLDPAEKARRDMIDWVGNTTDELSRQIEQTEAEAEALQATRKKKASGDRLSELEELNERRQWHISKLELVQRMLENGTLPVEDVENVQEDIKYFVEANAEEDFDYDQGLYDELNLQEEEDYIHDYGHVDEGSNVDDASVADVTESVSTGAPKTPAKEDKDSSKKGTPASKATSTTTHEDAPSSPVSAKKVPSRKAPLETKTKSSESIPPVPSVPTPVPAPTPKAASLPPIRYAAAAAAAVASSAPASSATAVSQPGPETSPSKANDSLPPAQLTETPQEEAPTPAPAQNPPKVSSPDQVDGQANGHSPAPPPGISATQSPLPSTQQSTQLQTPAVPPQTAVAPPGYAPQHAESSRAAQQPPQAAPQPIQPGVMGNLMHSFEMAKELCKCGVITIEYISSYANSVFIAKRRTNDVHELNAALDGSYGNIPQQLDAEPPRYYHPKNPIKTPSYYPQSRLPILEDKSIYSRLDLDQLFYIFYYMTGTYEQWLAARELKRQSWRFHKQYLTWFQRAHNPQAITEDYEQGGYYYFDWENSWCQRRKSDFRFEYRWLSDH